MPINPVGLSNPFSPFPGHQRLSNLQLFLLQIQFHHCCRGRTGLLHGFGGSCLFRLSWWGLVVGVIDSLGGTGAETFFPSRRTFRKQRFSFGGHKVIEVRGDTGEVRNLQTCGWQTEDLRQSRSWMNIWHQQKPKTSNSFCRNWHPCLWLQNNWRWDEVKVAF